MRVGMRVHGGAGGPFQVPKAGTEQVSSHVEAALCVCRALHKSNVYSVPSRIPGA